MCVVPPPSLYLNVSPVLCSTGPGDWVWDDIQFLARLDSNKQNNITDSDGWRGAGQICVWLLAGRQVFSLLLFLFPVCRKLLALVSFTPHCSLPCFQERRDEHLLISGWLLISNLVPVLDSFSPPNMKSGLEYLARRKHLLHLLR